MTKTEDLNNLSVLIESRPFDFSEEEGWNYAQAEECETCEEVLVARYEGEWDEHEENTDCEGGIWTDGPMMGYLWPLPDLGKHSGSLEHVARQLVGLPLCAVETAEGEVALALTGGGMDLSWEICAAYISLDCLPPFALTDLPGMAGYAEKYPHIIAACRRTCEVLKRWAVGRMKSLDSLAN